nr:uncharacterized protein LOC116773293 [Danaus plexippus plexippus]
MLCEPAWLTGSSRRWTRGGARGDLDRYRTLRSEHPMQANLVIYEPGAARPGTSLAFHIMAMQLVSGRQFFNKKKFHVTAEDRSLLSGERTREGMGVVWYGGGVLITDWLHSKEETCSVSPGSYCITRGCC